MNLWRLEWLRLTRTPRAIALAAIFLFIGFIEPIVTKYENDLVGHLGRGARISLPPPTPASALNSYVSEITLIGLIVVVAVAASALSFDNRKGFSIFLRTRATIWQLVLPPFVACACAAAVAYLLGTLAAWYETRVLIGSLPAGAVFGGLLCAAVYLAFAVALTAFATSLVRATIGAVGITLAILLVLPIAGTFHRIANWLPSALVNAPVQLVDGSHQLSHFWPPLTVTVAASAAALMVAVRRLKAREI
jgi:ABC-2 type transport system permease protein